MCPFVFKSIKSFEQVLVLIIISTLKVHRDRPKSQTKSTDNDVLFDGLLNHRIFLLNIP